MPSARAISVASVALSLAWTVASVSVGLTSPDTGNQFIADFAGWTTTLNLVRGSDRVDAGFIPLTVFNSDGRSERVTCAEVKDQVQRYKEDDDVFEEYFLQDAVTVRPRDLIPNGPYLAQVSSIDAVLAPVYRVHYDENMAFMNGLLPDGDGFKYATTNTLSDSTLGIPVPSKLYSKNSTKPLSGLRVAVKDIIDLKGVKTSNGNRAWFKLYDAVNETAPAIQRLIDLGANILGKVKTAQFANSDRPTADWVDYHNAFNPRGDGYQDPGVSSAGSGAATASYDWVDVAIGTDTGGSIRIPAGKNGVYGLRPSFGALLNEGVMEEGEYFDAVGFYARSPDMLQEFGKTWLGASQQLTTKYHAFPRKVIVPTNLWPVSNNASQAVFDEWINELSSFLNATVERKSIDEYWNATAHIDKPDTDFWEYMQMVGFNLIWKNQLEKVIEPFEADYAAAFDGRSPFINPFPAARYASAANITDEDVDEAYERFAYFREWFGKNVVKSDANSCSESVFAIPMATGDVSYRNNVYSPPNVSSWATFTPYYFSVQSQGPEVTLPIGEVSYMSNITNVEEKLPVAIDLLAHRNCDLMLLDLINALADEGLLREVKTGRTLW
ncbi:amidase signature domain-containing protein [Aspergillus multicolor]|uniref:amidase signature domain-containing protein n=1 Tax=Aspergillus multicolor TaxID=41759 RepID=UPI003CCD7C1D